MACGAGGPLDDLGRPHLPDPRRQPHRPRRDVLSPARYDVALVTSLLLLSPVLGVVFGVWLLHEPMTMAILIGSALTLSGVFIIALRQRRTEIVAIAPAQGAIEPLPAFAAEGWPHPVAEPAAKG